MSRAKKKTGRNAPCPCGSGLKFKRCCLPAKEALRFTRADRERALSAIEEFSASMVAKEDDDAYDEFFEDHLGVPEHDADYYEAVSEAAFNWWFWFDRPLDDGRLVVDRLLSEVPELTAGERTFLELCRDTCMRLYEVDDVRPGTSITLRDVLDGVNVTVREQSASRQLSRGALLAVRLIARGVSGEPEMEAGVMNCSLFLRQSLMEQASEHRAEFRRHNPGASDVAFFKEMPPFFYSAWMSAIIDPPIPRLQNTDGEDMLITRAHFDVLDRQRLTQGFDTAKDLEREQGDSTWLWTGISRQQKPVILGSLKLKAKQLILETNSAARGDRGRELIESLAGDVVRHRGTSHEDLTKPLRDRLRKGGEAPTQPETPEGIPAEVLEQMTLEHQDQHYRQWVDDSIPALEGKTPREAADMAALRGKLVELIRGLEGVYERALKRGDPAYDPSWMWAELGLAEPTVHPPPLAYERWAQAVSGMGDISSATAERARERAGFDDGATLHGRESVGEDLEIRRFLAEKEKQTQESSDAAESVDAPDVLRTRLWWMVNFDLHRHKTFWVDESLAYTLGQTAFDVVGDELRAPFPCFAIVFTDRFVLSLVERVLAAEAKSPLAGHMLQVVTAFVAAGDAPSGGALRLGIAADALGADAPYVYEHEILLEPEEKVQLPGAADHVAASEEYGPLPDWRPLPRLIRVILNAVLYATSAGVEPQAQARPSPGERRRRLGGLATTYSSEEVFFLPGPIEISRVRQMQAIERTPTGRQMLHRFMVRGHWRRPSTSWKQRHLRWIKPYWKGPDMAAIIERTYKLKP